MEDGSYLAVSQFGSAGIIVGILVWRECVVFGFVKWLKQSMFIRQILAMCSELWEYNSGNSAKFDFPHNFTSSGAVSQVV